MKRDLHLATDGMIEVILGNRQIVPVSKRMSSKRGRLRDVATGLEDVVVAVTR